MSDLPELLRSILDDTIRAHPLAARLILILWILTHVDTWLSLRRLRRVVKLRGGERWIGLVRALGDFSKAFFREMRAQRAPETSALPSNNHGTRTGTGAGNEKRDPATDADRDPAGRTQKANGVGNDRHGETDGFELTPVDPVRYPKA